MLDTQLYISDERVDLFDDESIVINDSIQDIKDLGKIFTPFTRSFSVPASSTNNKIFKHYYNSDIKLGFDARVRTSAVIKINGFNYKSGYIVLNEVKLKNNKAVSYSLVFYSGIVSLKETIGDDSLEQLTGLNDSYNHTYTLANVKTGVTTGLIADPTLYSIVYPLITVSKVYRYDSTNSPDFYDILNTTTGLEYTQLKPGLRIEKIVDEIETHYGITFSADFFATTAFTQLFLWLHRTSGIMKSDLSGRVTAFLGDIAYVGPTTDWIVPPYVWTWDYNASGTTVTYRQDINFDCDFVFTGTGDYEIYAYDRFNNTTLFSVASNTTANSTYTVNYDFSVLPYAKAFKPEFVIIEIGGSGITQVDIQITATRTRTEFGDTPTTEVGDYASGNIAPTANEVVITEQIPKMGVLDFLSNIFKMFNLTAYEQADGTIYVDTLDNYYALGTEIDITKYIDPTETTVSRALLYDKIKFKHADPSTALMIESEERVDGVRFGDNEYDNEGLVTDSDYTVELGFEKLMWERMKNENDGTYTKMLIAHAVDQIEDAATSINAASTKPILFYWNQTLTDAAAPDEVDIDWSDASTSTSYIMCNNEQSTGNQTINFGPEIDEYRLENNWNSLFENYYKNYIEGVYSEGARRVSMKATFPPSFILTYNLYDTLIVANKKYKINEIDIDLLTGEAELELITEW